MLGGVSAKTPKKREREEDRESEGEISPDFWQHEEEENDGNNVFDF